MSRNKVLVGTAALVCIAGLWYVLGRNGTGQASGAPVGMSGGPGMGGGGFRPTMTVELGKVSRARVVEAVTVVGSLIGAATVDVAPKVNGRLATVLVRMGDAVHKGQLVATVEDSEIQEQARQADAAFEVAKATVRQREADLKFSQTSLDRSKNLFTRSLIAQQTLDDSQARYEASVAQIDLARAQFSQAQARRDELQINLANTRITSPVDGFVGSRQLDPGAFVGPNASVLSVVDIHLVRLVANLVERDLHQVQAGMDADVNVDAYSGEVFKGRVTRIAPVLDPATRTAQMEVEVPNANARLKPGMYARVTFTVREHADALVVPRNSVVDIEGRRGVFVAIDKVARFTPIETGIQENDRVEVTAGLADDVSVVTTGAGSLRDGDPIQLVGQTGGGPTGQAGGKAGGTRPGRAGRPPAGPARQ
jgi:membrane fusion protein, multidrug efflux system